MFQDLRYGVRMLLKHPGFTCVAALTLALGIGANTAIFSLIDAVLLKMLPVKNPEQLVLLRRANSRGTETSFAYRTYKQFRDQNQVFSGLLAYYPLRMSVSVDNVAEPAIAGQLVSGNYYSVLGVNAALGRTIVPDDDRAPGESPVCVISYNYWQRRFASDPAVVGKTIHLSGAPFTIIGVSRGEFFGLEVGSSLDISVPLMMQQASDAGDRVICGWRPIQTAVFRVMGRLRPGRNNATGASRFECALSSRSAPNTPRAIGESNRGVPPLARREDWRRSQAAGAVRIALAVLPSLAGADDCRGPGAGGRVRERGGIAVGASRRAAERDRDPPGPGRCPPAPCQATARREPLAQQSRRFARAALRFLGNPPAAADAVAGRNPRPAQSHPRRPRARVYSRRCGADRRVVWPCPRAPGDAR